MSEEFDDFFANLPEEEVAEALKPPPPWPEQIYDGTITAAEKYQGEGKPYPCVKLAVTIVNAEGKTKKMNSWVLSKNPKAIQGSIRFLSAVGVSNKDYRHPSQLVGLTAPVQVVKKTNPETGVEYNEIKNFVFKRQK